MQVRKRESEGNWMADLPVPIAIQDLNPSLLIVRPADGQLDSEAIQARTKEVQKDITKST
jgi:hypothetical protein